MIHTCELTQQVSDDYYNQLCAVHKPITRQDQYTPKKEHHDITKLSERGITFDLQKYVFKHKDGTGETRCKMYLRLNPAKVLGGNVLSVFNKPSMYDELKATYHQLTAELFGENSFLTFLDLWKVRRIDYCAQLTVSDAPRYIKLMQRGSVPKRGKFYRKMDTEQQKKNHRSRTYETYQSGSIHLIGGQLPTSSTPFRHGSYNINFYDKNAEMVNENNKHLEKYGCVKYTEEQIRAAENVLRLEVQCKPRKIDNIAKDHYDKIKSLDNFLSLEDAQKLIEHAYTEVAGTGNYIKKKDAVQLIKASNRQQQVKNRLIGILDDMTGKGGSGNAVYRLREMAIIKRTFDSDIKWLHDNGINPVPLHETYKADELPNLLPAIQQYFEDIDTPFVDDIDAADDLDIEDLQENEE